VKKQFEEDNTFYLNKKIWGELRDKKVWLKCKDIAINDKDFKMMRI
jgi:hypothetical protein